MSEFASEGHREYPHLWADEMRTGEYLTWPLNSLQELNDQYSDFITDPSSFPPHVERAKRILQHIAYELGCRAMERVAEITSGK